MSDPTIPAKKMMIDIWSDIACPFCYIGKRKLEQALENLKLQDSVQIVWHSFMLDPDAAPPPGEPYMASLMAKKGWSKAQTEQIFGNVTQMAAEVGLTYNFDKMIAANTLQGHRLIHLATEFNLQDTCKEALLRAHFIEGQDIADTATLLAIGLKIGLPSQTVADFLANNHHTDAVRRDMQAAADKRISGVPFFIIAGQFTISGAQPVSVFEASLRAAFAEENK